MDASTREKIVHRQKPLLLLLVMPHVTFPLYTLIADTNDDNLKYSSLSSYTKSVSDLELSFQRELENKAHFVYWLYILMFNIDGC